MICLSVGERTVEACLRAVRGTECAEIRLDRLEAGPKEAAAIFAAHPRLIATCRPIGDEERKKDFLLRAIEAGAAFVDVEIEWEGPAREEIVRAARGKGCRVILSFHDHEKTPAADELRAIIDRCFEKDADIAKIACRVREPRDAARLLGLLDDERTLIVAGMGEKGRIVRIAAPLCGSFLTFASTGAGKETAEGQLDEATLKRILGEIEGV
jgi:3-dehydroquinate dehydratase I